MNFNSNICCEMHRVELHTLHSDYGCTCKAPENEGQSQTPT